MDRHASTIQTWDQLAAAYQEKFMDLDLYNDTYDRFCDLIPTLNASILEIACGPGNITRYLLSKRPDFRLEATDLAPRMLQLAKENNPTATFRLLDARDLHTLTQTYDGIMCGFCLPYLSRKDCAKLIKDASPLLTTDGTLYLSTIEGDYQNSGYETSSDGQHRMYVYYHSAQDLQSSLEENGFAVVELVRKSYTSAAGASSTHLVFIAKKK
ncbi:class I SAM-dependent methyltransferase [Rufibacter latericius]|uniref:Class I SAM-dependent methyltransferase n=1 Tax=Rufibacter latericius TaxID=2487040 RepID=A0A3M9MFI0_9BACT|nr:class I SAM-dependent methyltransferase [Rufibacter latericius]RNI23623.1 class I SAM-dependent methyltransferase [Rufibacter latericius]